MRGVFPLADIAILTATFYSDDLGGDFWYGGAERHMCELLRVLRTDGHRVTLYQRTHQGTDWSEPRFWEDVPVFGWSVPEGTPDPSEYLALRFYQEVRHDADLAIYHVLPLAYPLAHPRSIAFSHGIWWSDPRRSLPAEHLGRFAARHEVSLGLIRALLCCDTDSIGTLNNLYWRRWDHKLRHVPNFVDLGAFTPAERDAGDEVVVLYPRRLSQERGLLLAATLAEHLTATYPNVRFVFCGRGMPETEADLRARFAGNDRVEITWVPFEQMPAVYQRADIVLIPSLATEGTSLSVLEAMACARAVVASCLGGLTDLVIDGFNGFLVQPAAVEGFARAVGFLVEHPRERVAMGARGHHMARTFSLAKWQARVRGAVAEALG